MSQRGGLQPSAVDARSFDPGTFPLDAFEADSDRGQDKRGLRVRSGWLLGPLEVRGYLAVASASAGEVYAALDAALPAELGVDYAAQGSVDLGAGAGVCVIYKVQRYSTTFFRIYYNGGYTGVSASTSGGAYYFSW